MCGPASRQRFQQEPHGIPTDRNTPSKRGMHRSHDSLSKPPLAVEPTTGEYTCGITSAHGYYRAIKSRAPRVAPPSYITVQSTAWGDHGPPGTVPARSISAQPGDFARPGGTLRAIRRSRRARSPDRACEWMRLAGVSMDEPGTGAALQKDSSMRVAVDLVKIGSEACVSAGNTGALWLSRAVLKTCP